MSIEKTREIVERWLAYDFTTLSPNVVGEIVGTDYKADNADDLAKQMERLYHEAFEAEPVNKNLIVGDGYAALEYDFVGKHIGEFMGIAATGREVKVPCGIFYRVEDDLVTELRCYMAIHVLLDQIRS